ncbi:MAG: hypothetical protein JSV58_04015, partial [Candidatus Bathyarchaeota archaeon]
MHNPGYAQTALETILSVDPAGVVDPTLTPGHTFTVDIQVVDVEFLFAWQVNLSFNPDVLECIRILEGSFLTSQPEGTYGAWCIEEAWTLFGWSTLGSYAGKNGSGTLATVEFEVEGHGESTIKFELGGRNLTYLIAQCEPTPPPKFYDIPFTAEDGSFNNTIATTLYVHPASIADPTLTPGHTFTIDIKVMDVEFLYCWQVNLSFNPEVLQLINIIEGGFLAVQPNGTWGASRIEESWALFGWSTLGPHQGVNGSGTLATVEFKVLGKGESRITFETDPVYIDPPGTWLCLTFLSAQIAPEPPPHFYDIPFVAEDCCFDNTRPSTAVYFKLSPNPANVGDMLMLQGILLDESLNPLPVETVKIVARPLAGFWRYITSLITSEDGIFTWQVEIPLEGIFIIAAYYPGSTHYDASYDLAVLVVR